MSGFKEILVLGLGRSGSNLLSSILRKIDGNAGFFEIFFEHKSQGLQHFPPILDRVSAAIGAPVADCEDPGFLAARDADPVAYFDALSRAAQAEGYRSLTCKIFARQLTLPHLQALLSRPNLSVIFLTRNRIDRYISDFKGKITNQYVKEDTTALRPRLDIKAFLARSFQQDSDLDDIHAAVLASGVRYSHLRYEADLDQDEDLRIAKVAKALQAVGLEPVFTTTLTEGWVVKQDTNPHWYDKVENGFEAAAALSGLGLAGYAVEAPLMHVEERTSAPAAPVAYPRDETLPDRYSNYCILSTEPLITFSAIDNDRSYLAEWMSGPSPLSRHVRGLHFVKPTWSMETTQIGPLVASFRQAERCNPGHCFIVLHASEKEAERYRIAGQRSLANNSSIFTKETNFSLDAPPLPGIVPTDALYIARFATWKNHHLAKMLQRPLFVYAEPKADEAERFEEVRRLCPSAQHVNHVVGKGAYHYLDRAELNAVMSSARMSLALSTVEGFMRGSIESLLAGLPVLSVAASGGRDAFYTADTALIVEPTAEAVKAGVAELLSRNLSRTEVRRRTLDLLTEARRDFLASLNQLVRVEFGDSAPEITIDPLLDFTVRYNTLGKTLELLA